MVRIRTMKNKWLIETGVTQGMVSCAHCTVHPCTRMLHQFEHPHQIFKKMFPLRLWRPEQRLEPWGCCKDAAISTGTFGGSEGKDSTFWAYFISSAPCELLPVLLEMSGTSGRASAAAKITVSKPKLAVRPSGRAGRCINTGFIWVNLTSGSESGNGQSLPTLSCKIAHCHA